METNKIVKKIKKEFKEGNTIKVTINSNGKDREYIGKYAGINERKTVTELVLIGFIKGEYKPGVQRIYIHERENYKITEIKRSRLTGKTGEYISKMFDSYMNYYKKQKKIEEQRNKEEEELRNLVNKYNKIEDEYQNKIVKENESKLDVNVLVKDKLKELYKNSKKVSVFDNTATMFEADNAIVELGDNIVISMYTTIYDTELKYLGTYVEYDYTLMIDGESATKDNLMKEFEGSGFKLKDLNETKKGFKTTTHFGYQIEDNKVMLDVRYIYHINQKGNVNEIVRHIQDNILIPFESRNRGSFKLF